ncbi:transcriptional regulator NrdR [Microgenomates group bacterium RIFCSPLOWO2_01_FULL_47_10]|nr:MAG: transcriptional regulator NrdR [Microgenomates group bacterium RIFCSPLOWO2_01_FULL_47_10]
MQCPYCSATEHNVLESRTSEDGGSIRRRRECQKCGKRFTTYERVEGVDLVVIKKDGARQVFDREKIKRGLMKATWKRPVTIAQIDNLITKVEQILRRRAGTEVKSFEIGKLVINRLKKLDKVGYLLFATVYKDFGGIEDFEREIRDLKD